jgi:hypothetical protein
VSEGAAEQGRRILDEALRLLDVLQATRPAAGTGTGDGGAPGTGTESGTGSGHGGPECRYCPVCRGIAYLREADPEALDRLTGAVVDLASAVRSLVGGVVRAGGTGAPGQESGNGERVDVERVDVQPIDVQRIDRAD